MESKEGSVNEIIRRDFSLANVVTVVTLVISAVFNYALLTYTQSSHAKDLEAHRASIDDVSKELRNLQSELTKLNLANTRKFTRIETLIEKDNKFGKSQSEN